MPSSSARALAHSYGVAGSRVVPSTTIGFEPVASTSTCGWVDLIGQSVQLSAPQASARPNTGDAFAKRGSESWTSSSVLSSSSSAESRQLMAGLASPRFSEYDPSGCRRK